LLSYVNWTDYASRSGKLSCQPADCGGRNGETGKVRSRVLLWKSTDRELGAAVRRIMSTRAIVPTIIPTGSRSGSVRRNYLKGREGDRIDAVLAAAGHNFSLLLRWFEALLRVLLSPALRKRSSRATFRFLNSRTNLLLSLVVRRPLPRSRGGVDASAQEISQHHTLAF
jgi:hypothetical protein